MKFKYFLRGLGTGILFAAIILFVAYRGTAGTELSDEEIIKRAEALGMTQQKDTVGNLLAEEQTTSSKKNSETQSTTAVEKTTEKTTADASATEETTEETTEKASSQKTDAASGSGKTVTITVDPGSSSYPVCQKLEEAGMIENAAEFDDFLISNGYADRIRVGTHSLTIGMTFHEIAEAISDPVVTD